MAQMFSYIGSSNELYAVGIDNLDNVYRIEIKPNYQNKELNKQYPFTIKVFNKPRGGEPIFEDRGNFGDIIDTVDDIINNYYLNISNNLDEKLLSKLITDPVFPEAKYWYTYDSWRYYAGHYYNTDVHAYTPEGDYDKPGDNYKSEEFKTWYELLDALDEELLLTDNVYDIQPEDIDKALQTSDHKVTEYEVELEKEDDDEYGHYEQFTENITVTIYAEPI